MFGVGGYLVRADKALSMNKQWIDTLKEFSVECFHMNEIPDGNGYVSHLPRELRYALTHRLIGIINGHVDLAFASMLNTTTQFAPHGYPNIPQDPYAYSVAACVPGVCGCAAGIDPQAKVMLFFESGHATEKATQDLLIPRYAAEVASGVAGDTYVGMSFSRKKETCLLQAADLLMWQMARFVKNTLKNEPMTEEFKRLMAVRRHMLLFPVTGQTHVHMMRLAKPLDGDGGMFKSLFEVNRVFMGPYKIDFGDITFS
jgi:hypothetical protein